MSAMQSTPSAASQYHTGASPCCVRNRTNCSSSSSQSQASPRRNLQHFKTLYTVWKSRFVATFQSDRQINVMQAAIRIDYYAFLRCKKSLMIESRKGLELHQVRISWRRRVSWLIGSRGIACCSRRLIIHVRGEWSPGKEIRWMRRLRFGFVVYGFSYEESDTEWKTSPEKLNEGLGSGWEDVVGSEKVRGKATLHWIDGREKDIAEEDPAIASTQIDAFKNTPALLTGLSKTLSLAIAPQCVKSFLSMPSTPTVKTGDYHLFLQAISVDSSSPSPPEP